MPLINARTIQTPIERIRNLSTALLSQMKQTAKIQFDLVWKNKDYTPQQVSDMLGVEAVAAMDAHYNLQVLIASVDPTWVPLVPPLGYTRNQDGTITVQQGE